MRLARDYIYRCDECNAVFSNPQDPKRNVEHLNIKTAEVFFSHYSKTNKNWEQTKLNIPCAEYHFCSGRCLGKFVDKKVAEVTEKIKE